MTRAEFEATYGVPFKFHQQPRPYVQTTPHRIPGQLRHAQYVGEPHRCSWVLWAQAIGLLVFALLLISALGAKP